MGKENSLQTETSTSGKKCLAKKFHPDGLFLSLQRLESLNRETCRHSHFYNIFYDTKNWLSQPISFTARVTSGGKADSGKKLKFVHL